MGEAPTSWPVFRSCRLSFEIVAHAKTIAVMKSAHATRAGRVSGVGGTAITNADAHSTTERMPTPEIGLFEAPMRPAMYPQIPAMRKPPIRTNGTAISVSGTALGASDVDFANVKASQAAMTRHTAVSATIQPGARSRSRSLPELAVREATSVATSPPRTGLARVASV